MKKSERRRLIIRFVIILLVLTLYLLFGPIILANHANNKVEAAEIFEVVDEEPPSITTDLELVFEPIEYVIPLETIEETVEEKRDNEGTESLMATAVYENTTEAIKTELEVTTPISETTLIDFSVEVWEETYLASAQYDEEIQMMAKVMLLEAGGIPFEEHKAAICWTILNRFDAGYGPTIASVIIPGQFAYNPDVVIRTDLYLLAKDVVTRWMLEKQGYINVGRVLPADYFWYWGDGEVNWFRNVYEDGSNPWDWHWGSPY